MSEEIDLGACLRRIGFAGPIEPTLLGSLDGLDAAFAGLIAREPAGS